MSSGTKKSPRNSKAKRQNFPWNQIFANSSATSLSATGSSKPTVQLGTNVILFGETGVGKSSVINLIAQENIAKVSSDVNGCVMESTPYGISFDDMRYNIFDTIALEEPEIGVNGYLTAIEKAFELIKNLEAAGGIHLLLFCMRAGRITATTQSNYRMFYERLCDRKVPIALVFTGLEKEWNMEDWWERNKDRIAYYGFEDRGHACITAVHDGTEEQVAKYVESEKKIRDLIKDCALESAAPLPEHNSWFAGFARGLMDFIKKHLHPGKKRLMNTLTKRCGLALDVAEKIVNMMEKGDPEPDEDEAERAGSEGSAGVSGQGVDGDPPKSQGGDQPPQRPAEIDAEEGVPEPNENKAERAGNEGDPGVSSEGVEGISNTAIDANGKPPKCQGGDQPPQRSTDGDIGAEEGAGSSVFEVDVAAGSSYHGKLDPSDLTDRVTGVDDHPVASGGFADIYRGTLRQNGVWVTTVAIKAIKTYSDEDEICEKKKKKRLRREMKVWFDLQHPNILPLLGTTTGFGKYVAMVCPWAENGTLSSYLKENSLAEIAIVTLLDNVASGLHYLHSRSIVHGDLSGGNILIRKDGGAYISDFGVSMLLTELGGTTFATSYQTTGTLRWSAPELLDLEVPEEGMEDNSPHRAPEKHSDVYSFGRVMLQILSGKVPYHYYTRDVQIVNAISKGITPRRPSSVVVTEGRWAFIKRCWSIVDGPLKRPSSEEIVKFTKRELNSAQ